MEPNNYQTEIHPDKLKNLLRFLSADHENPMDAISYLLAATELIKETLGITTVQHHFNEKKSEKQNLH